MVLNPGAGVFTSRHGLRDVHAIERHGGEISASARQMREPWRPAHGDLAAAHTGDVQSMLVPAREPIDWIGFAV